MQRYVFLLMGMLLSLSLHAQQILLSGKVEDAYTGKGLSGVMVTIRPVGGNKILKFGKTQADGSYQLKVNATPEDERITLDGTNAITEGKYVLHFSMMGYATITLPLVADKKEYDVLMTEQATKLKDVVVKAPSIRQRGDTISYNVASFADASDKSLADVLKKMPGMEVSDNGEIKYNGKAINKFYIEGHDMLGGRYSIATNNIHQKNVGSVEVMTNHQPIKALEDMSFSEDPAINIKLKESAKSRLVGTVKVGGGLNQDDNNTRLNVWNGEMALMRFAKKTQSLNTFKSNNIGTDITREGNLLFSDRGGLLSDNYHLKNYLDVTPDRLTDISDSRVRKNQTHTLSTNNLWALGKNTDLSSQIIYSHDRLLSSSQSNTQYFLNDSTIVNEEEEHAKQKQNKLVADFTLTSNGAKSYITNHLSTDLAWNDITLNLSGSYPNAQIGKLPRYKVANNFEILERSGKRAYTFSSYNAYLVNPQSLSIQRLTDETAQAADKAAQTVASDHRQYQSVRSSAFFSHTSTSLGFYLKPFTVTMKVGVMVLARKMKSHLEGISDTLGNLRNDISMTYVRAYASPEAEFNQRGWHIRFQMPVAYTPYYYKDHLAASKGPNASKTQVSPHLSINYFLTSHLEMNLSGGFYQQDIDEQNFYQGLILRDYRNLYRGFVDYTADNQKKAALNLNYKRPLATFFANAYVSRSWQQSHLTTARDFVGDYIVNSYLENKSKSSTWMAGGRVSKGLAFMHGMVSLALDYLQFKGTLFQSAARSETSSADSKAMDGYSSDRYISDNYMLTAKWNGRLAEWVNFSYELNWSKDGMTMKNIDFKSSSISLAQHLACHIQPLKSWFIHLQGEHYSNQVAEHQHKNLFLADASSSYSFKSGIEISFTALNLFNQRTYGYTSYSGLTRVSKEYQLRGRTLLGSIFFHF